MRRIARLCAFACFATCTLAAAQAIVPAPASYVRHAGEFHLSRATPIVVVGGAPAAQGAAVILSDWLGRTNALPLAIQSGAARDRAINLRLDSSIASGAEGYRLEVRPARVTVAAATPAGLFHGATTLWQMIAPGARARVAIPAAVVEDAPRFPWRGMMLDSARHFQSPDFVRRFLDAMAMHKLNVLHWHLTDDQAWRLEIRKYPALTRVGAWRVPAGAARGDIDPATGKPRLYGGFYTQKDVRALVAYAQARGITIVPEIDVPGHVSAMVAAYPELAAAAPPHEVPSDWGIYPIVLNTKESTFAFVEDVLAEVLELFPGPYIHKGGDEVHHDEFTPRIAKFLEAHGRRLVGWDEILAPGLAPSAVVMSWRGVEGALAAAAQGHDTVLAPDPTLYFDNRQGLASDEPPGRIRVLASLESVYRFEPMPEAIAPERRRHVLGLQGNLWTEHVRTEERAGWMTFPRAAAIAELGWSLPQKREWRDFARRVAANFDRYEALRMPYSDSAFAVNARTRYAADAVEVALSTQAGLGEIRYTVDGREPTQGSTRYREPLRVAMPATLRAAAFDGDRRISRPRAFALRRENAQRLASHQMKLCGNAIALALEDDAPFVGPRAVFAVDIQNPCWIFPDADLDRARSMVATVGQLPFNFQIGEEVKKIRFAKPATPEGELEVHLGDCDGELLASLPLAPAVPSPGVTTLPRAALRPAAGRHDLCLRFAQPTLEPLWVIDTVSLDEGRP
jgi:hexosaminidase